MQTEKSFIPKKLILASQSPRRHSLIKKLNIDFDVIVSDYEEKLSSDDYTDEVINSLSLNKALSVLEKLKKADISLYKNRLIVSADTMVVLDNKIYGKPKDENCAKKNAQRTFRQNTFCCNVNQRRGCGYGKVVEQSRKDLCNVSKFV